MAGKIRKLLCAVLLSSLLGAVALCAHADETAKLPLDFSGGMPLQRDGFSKRWTYEDPTISVTVVPGRTSNDCDYWVATIKIADASQLRTIAADNYSSNMTRDGSSLARRVNAVLAINGDYYWYTGEGLILRQGQVYQYILKGKRDVLLIDEDGDFHVIKMAQKSDIGPTINGKRIVNAFYFGPCLVEHGVISWDMELRGDMAAEERRQRMAIAQVGPLEYKCICCGPPARGSTGMTLMDFARLVADQGVDIAYNLDGGDSTMMFFNAEKVNDIKSESSRPISDIIYFASAYGVNK